MARPADVVSRNMRSVRSESNRADRLLGSVLWRKGRRYRRYGRLGQRILIGKPDIFFPATKLAVFVDGDFWHARLLHESGMNALMGSLKTPRRDWWIKKLTANAIRDARTTKALEDDGWTVLRLWERDVIKDPERAAAHVETALNALQV